ncbi:MAG: hypothetical protein ACRECF_02445 [Methyloceanibacter sp.]
MRLDRKKKFSTIHPPLNGATFKQNGKYFDNSGHEVDPETGKHVNPAEIAVAEVKAEGPSKADQLRAIAQEAPTLTLIKFAVKAAHALDLDEPPASTKSEIVGILNKKADELDAAPAHKAEEKAAAKAEEAAKKPEVIVVSGNTVKDTETGVDLTAWAKGKAEYLPAEVFKAIVNKYGKQCTTRVGALDYLIQEGVVTATEAMKLPGSMYPAARPPEA